MYRLEPSFKSFQALTLDKVAPRRLPIYQKEIGKVNINSLLRIISPSVEASHYLYNFRFAMLNTHSKMIGIPVVKKKKKKTTRTKTKGKQWTIET